MESIKKYYDNYSYPKVKIYTNRQKKRHYKLITKILSYGNLKIEDIIKKRILDAGCGTGEKSVFFAKNKAKVTGIDFSTNQIKNAQNLALKNKIKINFYKKNIIDDNLLDLGYFDIIVCTGVLHHTKNPYKGFLNLLSVLKKDGVIIIALYHKYARLRYRFVRFLLRLFISKKPEKLEFALNNYKILKFLKKAPKNTIYDRYLVPYESYHTLKEVRNWFLKNKIEEISFSNEFSNKEYLKIFEKKTLFFIAGIKK